MSIVYFSLAAVFEISGCFSLWLWLRQGRSPLWIVPCLLSLVLFAYLLTRVDTTFAGRAYAAYGGIYVAASLVWMWLVEGAVPDRFDLGGVALCLAGTAVILFCPHSK